MVYNHKSSLYKRKKGKLRMNNHTHEPKPPTTNIDNMLMQEKGIDNIILATSLRLEKVVLKMSHIYN